MRTGSQKKECGNPSGLICECHSHRRDARVTKKSANADPLSAHPRSCNRRDLRRVCRLARRSCAAWQAVGHRILLRDGLFATQAALSSGGGAENRLHAGGDALSQSQTLLMPNATPRSPSRSVGRRLSAHRFFLIISAACVAVLVGTAHFALYWDWLWSYLVGINLTTFALYAYDKRAAIAGRLRTPERVLHMLALFGGTPMAYAGQRLFRHKTIKGQFRLWFWMICSVQVVVVLSLLWILKR